VTVDGLGQLNQDIFIHIHIRITLGPFCDHDSGIPLVSGG
jgi:hypothetical protein